MNRAGAVAYLGPRYATYLAAVDRTAADSTGNLKEAIDDALSALGYTSSEFATADVEADSPAEKDYTLQLRFRTMEQVVRDLRATSFRLSTDAGSFDLGKLVDSAEHELAALAALVVARFGTTDIDVADSLDNPFGSLDLNFLAGAYV